MLQFKQFIEEGIVSDDFTKELDNEVKKVLNNEAWRSEYMKSITWEMDAKYEGIFETLFSLVDDGILTASEAAKRAKLSEEEFMEYMEDR